MAGEELGELVGAGVGEGGVLELHEDVPLLGGGAAGEVPGAGEDPRGLLGVGEDAHLVVHDAGLGGLGETEGVGLARGQGLEGDAGPEVAGDGDAVADDPADLRAAGEGVADGGKHGAGGAGDGGGAGHGVGGKDGPVAFFEGVDAVEPGVAEDEFVGGGVGGGGFLVGEVEVDAPVLAGVGDGEGGMAGRSGPRRQRGHDPGRHPVQECGAHQGHLTCEE